MSESLNLNNHWMKGFLLATAFLVCKCNDAEGIALHKLARLYGELGQADQAAVYYNKDLDPMYVEERQGPNYVEALFPCQVFNCKCVRRYEEAEQYAARLDIMFPLFLKNLQKETVKSIL